MSRRSKEFMGTPAELFHWVPGEMIMVVRLPRLPLNNALDPVVEQIHAQLNAFLAQYQLSLEPYGTYGRWSENPSMPPVRRRAFVFGFSRKQPFIALFFHTRTLNNFDGDPLPLAISYIQGHLEYFAQLGLTIISVMPNWLVTAAPVHYSAGGPFTPPTPAPHVDISAPANALPGWHIKFMDFSNSLDTRGVEDVVVAVLDTAHHPDHIRSAATRPELRRNWLLQRIANDLRVEDGAFAVEYDRYAVSNDVRTGRGYTGESSYYFMPDHGLSVAGLVRDIAPRVRVRLIRVLNDFGGGDLYALFAALTDLERELFSGSIRRLVINLSLTIMPDIKRLSYVWLDQRQWTTTQLMGIVRVLTQIEEGLKLLCECLAGHGALIVAAAGNDSFEARQKEQSPRPPRAPARYDSTLGVTAVNHAYVASMFANAGSMPPVSSGIATIGGDVPDVLDEQGLPDAIRGIYISASFPSGEQNVTGWADWRGSSFATAIISGLGAHLLAQGWSAANIIARLTAHHDPRHEVLFGAQPDEPDLLTNIVRVQQRFSL